MESYPSAEMQSVYSTAPANWALPHLLQDNFLNLVQILELYLYTLNTNYDFDVSLLEIKSKRGTAHSSTDVLTSAISRLKSHGINLTEKLELNNPQKYKVHTIGF